MAVSSILHGSHAEAVVVVVVAEVSVMHLSLNPAVIMVDMVETIMEDLREVEDTGITGAAVVVESHPYSVKAMFFKMYETFF